MKVIIATPDIESMLTRLVGKIVSVYCGVIQDRSQFSTSISTVGKLELHSEKEQYRTVVADGCYCYFSKDDVLSIIDPDGTHTFKDGSCAVIRLDIQSKI